MTSIDANILLYSYSEASPHHAAAKTFLESLSQRDGDLAVSTPDPGFQSERYRAMFTEDEFRATLDDLRQTAKSMIDTTGAAQTATDLA